MEDRATTSTNLWPATASVADQSLVRKRLDVGRQPEPHDNKRRGFPFVAGWLFVGWMLMVCGSYLYFILRTLFG